MIKEITSKRVLTYHEGAFPTNWDLNPYRGCSIGCKYCYAQYTHKYIGLDDFFKDILVKTNTAEKLDCELHEKKWKHEQIKIGGTTDLYQHIEKKYELLPKIYNVIKKYRNPIFIQTKSNLILRDFEIIKELSKITTVDIATSVSVFDEKNRIIIEPFASKTIERIEMLNQFNGSCRTTILGFIPIIPYLSDTEENLETIFELAKKNNINHVITSALHLRGELKPKFSEIIKQHFPHIYSDFISLYNNSEVKEEYYNKLNTKIIKLRKKYNFNGIYSIAEAKKQNTQLSLPF